jgi:hypothetical protein
MKPVKLPTHSARVFIFSAAQSLTKPRSIGYESPRRFLSDARVIADQTKKDNSPDGEHNRAHEEKAAQTNRSNSAESDPAKQPDPQLPPTRSTGIEPSGPDGKAKEKE